jgi:hypothetical protein
LCVIVVQCERKKKTTYEGKCKREKAPLFCLVGEKGELYLEEKEKEKDRRWDPLSYMKRTWTPLCFLFFNILSKSLSLSVSLSCLGMCVLLL